MSEVVATSQQGLVEKYQPYPEYDDSGIEWLGRIPVHWKLATLKHECVFSGGGTPTKDNLAYWGGNIPWISPKDMKSQIVTDSIDKITAVAVAESSTKLVPEGALLMVVRSGILQRTIPVAINTVPVTLNQDMKALRFKSKDKACFFLYYIQGLESQLLLEWCKQGATVESIEHELLANARYPLPPNDELKAINQFLDYETARIDRLITQQLRLIELLKEKRQAVISHAVTKGLNPDAPMKDSGVEWLGQVPEHWGVSALGYYSMLNTGATPDRSKNQYWGGTIPWIKTGEVRYDTIYETEETITQAALSETSVRLSKPGTLLMAMYGQGITRGRVAILGVSATYNQACVAITPNSKVTNDFLKFFFMAGYDALRDGGNETSQMNLNADIVSKFKVLVPSYEEQIDIVSFLRIKLAHYEQLINKSEHAIALMQERRTALISAAVTGKIDLRGWEPPAEEAAA